MLYTYGIEQWTYGDNFADARIIEKKEDLTFDEAFGLIEAFVKKYPGCFGGIPAGPERVMQIYTEDETLICYLEAQS